MLIHHKLVFLELLSFIEIFAQCILVEVFIDHDEKVAAFEEFFKLNKRSILICGESLERFFVFFQCLPTVQLSSESKQLNLTQLVGLLVDGC
jgi:hypothetical protein